MKTFTSKQTLEYIRHMNPPMENVDVMINWLLDNDPLLEEEYHMRCDLARWAYRVLTKKKA